ncbi:MAG TPA: hypothetical protein VGM44_00240 [Polyangiaceae bacterium]|jgi:hypothetical protein
MNELTRTSAHGASEVVHAAAFAFVLALAACGGRAMESASAASAGSGGASDGGTTGNRATSGNAGTGGNDGVGASSSCGGAPEVCVSDCAELTGPYQVCVGSHAGTGWQCQPENYFPQSQCPRCDPTGVECCDSRTGKLSSPSCPTPTSDPICPDGLDSISAGDVCSAIPAVCRVSSVNDLAGRACLLGDPDCQLGSGQDACSCSCVPAANGPVWGCTCLI